MSDKQINDGGPAFPMPSGPEPRHNATTHYNEGMTLRDYFAAHALQSISSSEMFQHAMKRCANGAGSAENSRRVIAIVCYGIADAMLAARSSPTPNTPGGAS